MWRQAKIDEQLAKPYAGIIQWPIASSAKSQQKARDETQESAAEYQLQT